MDRYPIDLVVCVALGVDMFDCVFPTRTARFGVALVNEAAKGDTNGSLRPKRVNSEKIQDTLPRRRIGLIMNLTNSHDLDIKCFSGRRKLVQTESADGYFPYITLRMLKLSKEMREAIKEKRFTKFVQDFMIKQYPKCDYPKWILEAMDVAGIK